MLKHTPKLLNNAGDTIVEVMVVLAIFGLALGIAYATANRSLLNTRQAQENSTATEIAQGQIENLINLGVNNSSSPDYIFRGGLFCINSGHVAGVTAPNTFSVAQLTQLTSPTYAEYPADGSCQQQNFYHIAIQYSASSNDLFTIQITWDDVTGQGQDTVTMMYRLHP